MPTSSPLRTDQILTELTEPVKDEAIREYRTVGSRIIVGKVEPGAEQRKHAFQWETSPSALDEEVGEVFAISPDICHKYPIVDALLDSVYAWLKREGLDLTGHPCTVAQQGCRAVPFHNDVSFAHNIFCVVWLGDTEGLELVFPDLGNRVPLEYGTCVLFDPLQPHGVLWRKRKHFSEAHYEELAAQAFVSIDIPAHLPAFHDLLGLSFMESRDAWAGKTLTSFSRGQVQVNHKTGRLAWADR